MSSTLHPRLQELEKRFGVSTLTQIVEPEFTRRGLKVVIKRDDLLHPVISGNKWRKLKYILNDALQRGADTVVSMGGAYSNHLHALAYAGQQLGLRTRAYVRGEAPAILNPTLLDLQRWGMELQFVSRSDYRQLRQYREYESLPGLRDSEYWLPEGGATELALGGVAEIVNELEGNFDVLMTACGTGTTLAGLIAVAPENAQLLGLVALKGGEYLADEIRAILPATCGQRDNWQLLTNYHHGGFAKSSPQLLAFMADFRQLHGVVLDSVYTGKLLYGFYDLVGKDFFADDQRIVLLHTGGLQGDR